MAAFRPDTHRPAKDVLVEFNEEVREWEMMIFARKRLGYSIDEKSKAIYLRLIKERDRIAALDPNELVFAGTIIPFTKE